MDHYDAPPFHRNPYGTQDQSQATSQTHVLGTFSLAVSASLISSHPLAMLLQAVTCRIFLLQDQMVLPLRFIFFQISEGRTRTAPRLHNSRLRVEPSCSGAVGEVVEYAEKEMATTGGGVLHQGTS
ncbi:hypothetical protein PIB30_000489 [Stylosanthes scabra]|uniref:Uncharacterized protein n=1 Tax=Stylosanthes scabra TaxID=79078 RepID=A0ABU6W140_9FABA|nr:hypothetical protein [Stylosanthes scabra]